MSPVYNAQKQPIISLRKALLFVPLLVTLVITMSLPTVVRGQTQQLPFQLNIGQGSPSFAQDFHEYIIPSLYSKIRITLNGAEGEPAYFNITDCRYLGGRSANISASFIISSAGCPTGNLNLKPGGRLRFIIGFRAITRFDLVIPDQGSGGAGTAVFYLPPEGGNWVLLMVAGGGGGGARVNILECSTANGRDAELGESGSDGNGLNPGSGGVNGNGGEAGGLVEGDAGGGGGYFTKGGDGNRPGIGGSAGGITRGPGGTYQGSVLVSPTDIRYYTLSGGFGFGGGGAGAIAGGGGGGYSGGGGGGRIANTAGGGGGGGSYVIPGAVEVEKRLNERLSENFASNGSFSTQAGFGSTTAPPTRLYVKANAAGSNNGTTWANAFNTLQDALTAANSLCQAEIWVAAGTYRPDEGVGFTDNERSHSFVVRSGVAIYGGFAGNETALSARNFITNPTFLSGDLLQNNSDYTNAQFNNYNDNSYHVVRSENANNTAILDGFYIHSGNANVGNFPNNSGGGIYCYNSGIQISNCTVYFNQANEGGGLYSNLSSSVFSNCFFKSNKVVTGGAGVYVYNNSNPYFYNCVFQGNFVGRTTPDGGGGGAILNAVNSAPEYINCTISGNSAQTGGAVYNLNNSHPIFYNSIIWQNTSITPELRIATDPSSSMSYRNCLVQGLNLSGSFDNLDGSNASANVFTFPDNPAFAPQAFGILTLATGSPAIDKGNNGYLDNPTDIAGNPRFINTLVDIGAFEFQITPPGITTTSLSSSGNPGCDNANITFTASVLSGGNAVTTGSVTFSEGATILASAVALNANGQASFSIITLNSGPHTILATYNPSTGFNTSNASINQIINALPSVSINGNRSFCPSEGTALTANATAGSGTIASYQWRLNGSNISNANNATYTANVGGEYTVVVTNSNGCSTTSGFFNIFAYAPPTASISGNASVCSGGSTELNANATAGSGTIASYQWRLNGNNILNATNPTYTANAAGTYAVVVIEQPLLFVTTTA